MSWLCGSSKHWTSSDEQTPAAHPIKSSVKRQVQHVRQSRVAIPESANQLDNPFGSAEPHGQQQQNAGSHAYNHPGPTLPEASVNHGDPTVAQDDIQNVVSGRRHAESPGSENCRPSEMETKPRDEEEYRRHRRLNDLRAPYRIPIVYLAGTQKHLDGELPEAPLIVFINSRSGGGAGPRLKQVLCRTVGSDQVYDLHDYRPADVLTRIWENLGEAEARGDPRAKYYRESLRILAAGGDGTVAWILATIADLRLHPAPQVAVLPLGTGNDLSLSFGWGNTFLPKWLENYGSVYDMLRRIAEAQPRYLDCWNVSFTADNKERFGKLPYSLASVKELASSHTVSGRFWNYMSVGVDAEAAYSFHHLREQRPWATRGRLSNQLWYSYFGISTGGLSSPPPISRTVKLQVRQSGEAAFEEVHIPPQVKGIAILNLQSYAGGRDLWGLDTHPEKLQRLGFRVPIYNDGLLEVVGLQSILHTGWVMAGVSRQHSMRLAQTPEIRLTLRSSEEGKSAVAYMQLDGEPWRQTIPSATEDSTVSFTVDIRQADVSRMLCNPEILTGMARKVKDMAARGAAISAETPVQVQRLSSHGALQDKTLAEH